MSESSQSNAYRRRTLLVVAWALVFIAMTREEQYAESPSNTGLEDNRPAATTVSATSEAESSAQSPALTLAERYGVGQTRPSAPVYANPPLASSPQRAGEREVLFASARAIAPLDKFGRANYLPDQLIVRFQEGVSEVRQRELIASVSATIQSVLDPRGGEYVIQLPPGTQVADASDRIARYPEIDYAEPDILHYVDAVPSDSLYAFFYGNPNELQRWYLNGNNIASGLNAEAAWEITTGAPDVVIAIIDTGIALNHPDLAANIWTNTSEIPNNGFDDDANGFIDDVFGWDFYSNDNDPNPDLGDGIDDDGQRRADANVYHGTFVAGCAAAVSDNGEGVVGAAWYAQLMSLKVFTDDGGAPASAISRALYYAADNGADVVNMSFGSSAASSSISRATSYAWSRGLVLIAAAGNGNSDSPQYPARYANVISVGGLGVPNGNGIYSRAWFSQYGPAAVDVVAPAVNLVGPAVLSVADQMNGYGEAGEMTYLFGSGTSFAAPLVAGEAALLIARARELGLGAALVNVDYRAAILAATTDMPDDPNDSPDAGADWDNHGRVDFLAALQMVGPELVRTPRAPSGLKAKATGTTTILLSWKDESNNEQGFRIERAQKVGALYGSFETVGEVSPNRTTFVDTSAQPGTGYIYRIWATNVAGQSVSLPVRAKTKRR